MTKAFLFIFLVVLTSCSNTSETKQLSALPTPEIKLKEDIPKDNWVKIYFEGIDDKDDRGINKIAGQNGFPVLSETVLPKDDLEVRVWVGFGKAGNDGFVLKRTAGNWSAVSLPKMLCHGEKRGKYDLPVPKSGWEATWRKLVDAEILTLPDSSQIKYGNGAVDGKSYVVETNHDYVYRTYNYANPNYEKAREAGQIIKIGEIIADEFNLRSFSIKTGGCGEND